MSRTTKTEKLSLRMKPAERALLEEASERTDELLSEFVRRVTVTSAAAVVAANGTPS